MIESAADESGGEEPHPTNLRKPKKGTMISRRSQILSLAITIVLTIKGSASATAYYVDCAIGKDTNSGTTTKTAWKVEDSWARKFADAILAR